MPVLTRGSGATARIFISYAHEDERFRNELVKHLRVLEREKLIEIWHDRKITVGEDWSRAIHDKLSSAAIFIMLVSADFIDSDYCYGLEMTAALRAAERGEAYVIPVLVRHAAVDSAPFARLQMLPNDRVPVSDYPSHDKAWTEIVTAVRELVTDRTGAAASAPAPLSPRSDAPSVEDWRRLREALLARLRALDRSDDWVDQRFTDLAAEVEAESSVRQRRWLPWLHSKGRQLRRVSSLHSAIITTSDRLSLVTGDPGSGKSVAMRHAARQVLEEEDAADHPLLALYVNLRDFSASAHDIKEDSIREYVLAASCREMETEAATFLDRYFDWALTSGRLLILLDSFDEIPEVLGSGEPDATVTKYAEAIHNFANGMHDSRIIVSSRPYRGPGRMRWPWFRILPLDEERRQAFIRGWFDDDAAAADAVRRELLRAVDLDGWIDNPLLLALLCAYRKAHGALPGTAHEAFESFVSQRISSRPDILQSHRLSSDALRAGTEQIAFTMNAEASIGLAPSVDDLVKSLRRNGVAVDVETVVECLVDLHLGRGAQETSSQRRVFSFVHRRVQEYFCTCFALRCPEQLDISELAANERWRETAVTLLQTADTESCQPLLATVREKLRAYDAEIVHNLGLPLRDLHSAAPPSITISRLRSLHGPRRFPWPPGLLHLLGILSDYRISGAAREIEEVRRSADASLLSALALGLRIDQATALQVSGAMSSEGRRCALAWAFTSDSRWLEDIAFERSSYLAQLPSVIVARIGSMLVLKQLTGELRRERTRIGAQIHRLDAQARLLETVQALRRVVAIDLSAIGLVVAALIGWAYVSAASDNRGYSVAIAALAGGVLAVLMYLLGAAGVRRRALQHWRQHTPDRGELALNAVVALSSTAARAIIPAVTIAIFTIGLELPEAVPIACGVVLLFLLGHRPGVYCAAISGRAVTGSRELFGAVQPVVVLTKGIASRVGARALTLLIGVLLPALWGYLGAMDFAASRTADPLPNESEKLYLTIGFVFYGLVAIAVLAYLAMRAADSVRLRRCQRRLDSRSAVDALEEAAAFRREELRARYLRWIRENQLIAATQQNERVLLELLSVLEDVSVSGKPDVGSASDARASEFETWFTAYSARHPHGLAGWTHAIDELAQLVDQLRARLGAQRITGEAPIH